MVNGNRFIDVEFTSVPKSTVVNNGALRELDDYQLTIEWVNKLCHVVHSGKYIKSQKYRFLIDAIIALYECILLKFENSRKHRGYLK